MKNLLVATFIFLFPLSASASVQVVAGNVRVPTANGTLYVYYFTGNASGVPTSIADTITTRVTQMPVAGTFNNLRAKYDYDPGGSESVAITMRKNSTDQSVTCTISSGGTTCADTVNSFAVVQGDTVTMKIVYSASAPRARLSYTLDFTPTTANDTFFTARQAASASQTQEFYSSLVNNGFLNASEGSATPILIPEAGTMDKLTASTTAPGAGASYTFGLRTNQNATSTVTCTVDGNAPNWCSDNSNTLSISANDTVTAYVLPAGTPAVSSTNVAVRFVPSTAGNFNFAFTAPSSNDDSSTLNTYHLLSDAFGIGLANEASSTQTVNNMTITGLSVRIDVAPGASKSRTFALRQNGATTTLSCIISGAVDETCTDTDSIAIADGDLITVVDAPESGPNGTDRVFISLIANRNAAGESAAPPRVMRLFEGMRIKFVSGRIILYQR